MQIVPQHQSEGRLTFLACLLSLSNPYGNLWRIASDNFIHHMAGLKNGLVVKSFLLPVPVKEGSPVEGK